MFVACLGLLATTTMVSCSDDLDDNTYVKVSDAISANGLEVERPSIVASLPVEAKGDWIAVLMDDATDWAKILDEQVVYNGSQTLKISIDENVTGALRKGTLMLIDNNGNTTELAVRQTTTIDGQLPTNDGSTDVGKEPVALFTGRGAGYAIDFQHMFCLSADTNRKSKQFDPYNCTTGSLVLQTDTIKKHQDYYTFSNLWTGTSTKQDIAECVKASSFISGGLTIGVQFNIVRAKVEGVYTNNASDTAANHNLDIVKEFPAYECNIQTSKLSYEKDNFTANDLKYYGIKETTKTKIKEATKLDENNATFKKLLKAKLDNMLIPSYSGLYTPRFARLVADLERYDSTGTYWELMEVDQKTADERRESALSALATSYGPFIAAGVRYGGYIFLDLAMTASKSVGTRKISGSADVQVGKYFDGKATITYSSTGLQELSDCSYTVQMLGGEFATLLDSIEKFAELAMPKNSKDLSIDAEAPDITQALSNWRNSLKDNNFTKVAPVAFTVLPIWDIMPQRVRDTVRNYFLNKAYTGTDAATLKKWVTTFERKGQNITKEEIISLINEGKTTVKGDPEKQTGKDSSKTGGSSSRDKKNK